MNDLNVKQREAMKKVMSGNNVYISGPGGVGKSYLINKIMAAFEDSTILLAPTGIAALNIGGATIHSTFKFPLGVMGSTQKNRVNDKVRDLFDKNGPVRRIVVDEVSMVRGDMFQAMDIQLRKARRLNVPFGGLQVIVVGDFYQLPPVVTNREKSVYMAEHSSPYAFEGEAWSEADFEYFELDEIMRQSDEVMIDNLQKIRQKANGFDQSVSFFNHHARQNTSDIIEEDPVFLCTTNRSADLINEDNYSLIDEQERVFIGEQTGKVSAKPSPEHLKLKFGTKVIFTANCGDEFRNGEVGYVTGFAGDRIEVTKESTEATVFVERFKWEERDYTTSNGSVQSYPIGTYKQYPLKHGYAVTIHKSQGMSLDHAVIDWGRGAFCHGQAYVALSRLRTLEGLGMIGQMTTNDVIVDREVTEFYEQGCRGIGLL